MGSTFDSHPYTIGSLLGDNERRSVHLPEFQRGFSWELAQVSTFWNDMLTFKETFDAKRISASYFLGPIVLQDSPEKIILLDGQQRLATGTILLACMRDIARTLDKTGHHLGSDLARDIQRKFIEKDDVEPIQYSLLLGELDEAYFLQSIKSDPPHQTKPTLRSHRLIQSAYKYFWQNISEDIQKDKENEAIRILKDMRDCLTKGMTMVAIMVQSEEDAYGIFETLNDRGLRLSVPDLLLNLLMRRAPDDNHRSSVRKKWNYMLQVMGQRDIARFLRHMWLSKYGDLKSRGLYSEIKDHLQKNKINSLTFAETCADECDNYNYILEITNEIPKEARNDVEGLVKFLNSTSSFPLLLSGLSCLNRSDFTKLAKVIAALVVRYSVTANLNPAQLESMFYEAARELRGKKSTNESSAKCLRSVKIILAKINPTDGVVEENSKELELNRKQGVWIITNLAKAIQSKTKEIQTIPPQFCEHFLQNST